MAENETTDSGTERTTGAHTANAELRSAYGKYLWIFTAAALAVHVLVIFFFVTPRGGGFEAQADELEVIEIPPEIRIPPPPEGLCMSRMYRARRLRTSSTLSPVSTASPRSPMPA